MRAIFAAAIVVSMTLASMPVASAAVCVVGPVFPLSLVFACVGENGSVEKEPCDLGGPPSERTGTWNTAFGVYGFQSCDGGVAEEGLRVEVARGPSVTWSTTAGTCQMAVVFVNQTRTSACLAGPPPRADWGDEINDL